MPAFRRVEHFVREVAAEQKRLPPTFFDRSVQAVVVAVEPGEDPSLTQLLLEIHAGFFTLFGPAGKRAIEIEQHVAVMIGAIQAIHQERYPSRSAFEKGYAQLWKAIEHAVGEHARALDHQAKGMTQSVRRIIGRERIEPHTI